jgi:hypothetical protein
LGAEPGGGIDEAAGQEVDVEHVGPVVLLAGGEQVEQQGAEARLVQDVGDVAVAGAVAAAAAAVREHDHPGGVLGQGEVPAEVDRPSVHVDLCVADRRVVTGRGAGRRCGLGGSLEAGDDLVVGGLGEVLVELADREERVRCLQRDELVGSVGQARGPLRWGDGYGQHHPSGPVGAGDLTGRTRGRPGGDAVIDDHRDAALEAVAGPVAPEPLGPTFELGPLAGLDPGQLGLGHTREADHLVVDDPHAVLADRAHAQLGLERHTELADHDHIQRGMQGPGHLERDGHPAPREAEHDHRLATEMPQPGGQPPSCIDTIEEVHHDTPSG